MVFVPPPPPASPRAQELGRRLGEQIDAYRREHPDLSGLEIRQALRLAHRGPDPRPVIIAVAVGAAVLAGVMAAFSQKSGGAGAGMPTAVFLVPLVILALIILFRRLR